MRAAVLREFGRDLELSDRPMPRPSEGELLIRVRAAGLCGTDLKLVSGAIPGLAPPLVPGHEVAGEVVGSGHGFESGQRVAAFIFAPCGDCPWCELGQETLCPHASRIGFERDGGLSEYLVMEAQNLLPVGALPFAEAAVCMDAVLSPWRALRTKAQLLSGERVVIVGAGGLGLHGLQIATAAEARVAVIEPSPSRRLKAIELGAEVVADPEDLDELLAWVGTGSHVALEVSGTADGFAAAARTLRPGGRLVVCGYRPGVAYAIDSARLALEELHVMGSRGGTREEARAALAAVQNGEVRPLIAGSGPLVSVNERLSDLRRGDVIGRQVITFDAA